MKIVTYTLMKDFIDENFNTLLKNDSINELLIFNSLNKEYINQSKELNLGKIINSNNETSLLFVSNENYNLIAYSPNETINIEAIKTLVSYVINNDIKINKITANKCICDTFIRYYKKIIKKTFIQISNMEIMTLSILNDFKVPNGFFRQATTSDLELLCKWYYELILETTNTIPENINIKVSEKINNNEIFLFENDTGQPVSMASIGGKLKNHIYINDVYTDEAFRNQRFGSAVVFNLSKFILNEGNKFCTLFVDKYNSISNKLYRNLGFSLIDNIYTYEIN